MRKQIVYPLVLIILISCSCCPRCDYWKLAVIKGDCPSASYVKVYLPPCNTFNGLEALFMSCNGNISLYFNALTLLFPCLCNDEKHSEVLVMIDEKQYHFTADRLQGGQRILMPEDAMLLMTRALLEKRNVEVTAGRYHALLTPDNFEKVYQCLIL